VVIPYITAPLRHTQEIKYTTSDLHTIFHGVSTVPGIWAPTAQIAVGSDMGQRIARNILVKHFTMRGVLVGGQSNIITDDKYNTARIVVAEYNPQVAAPFGNLTLSNVIDSRDAFPGIGKVYFDQTYLLTSIGPDSVGYLPSTKKVSIDIPLNIQCEYNGAPGNTISRNNLVIGMVTDSVAAPSPGFESGFSLMTYVDN
jgi:hypothetical protein